MNRFTIHQKIMPFTTIEVQAVRIYIYENRLVVQLVSQIQTLTTVTNQVYGPCNKVSVNFFKAFLHKCPSMRLYEMLFTCSDSVIHFNKTKSQVLQEQPNAVSQSFDEIPVITADFMSPRNVVFQDISINITTSFSETGVHKTPSPLEFKPRPPYSGCFNMWADSLRK